MRVVIQHAFGRAGRCGHYFETTSGRLLWVGEHPPVGQDVVEWAESILAEVWGDGYSVDWERSDVALTLETDLHTREA